MSQAETPAAHTHGPTLPLFDGENQVGTVDLSSNERLALFMVDAFGRIPPREEGAIAVELIHLTDGRFAWTCWAPPKISLGYQLLTPDEATSCYQLLTAEEANACWVLCNGFGGNGKLPEEFHHVSADSEGPAVVSLGESAKWFGIEARTAMREVVRKRQSSLNYWPQLANDDRPPAEREGSEAKAHDKSNPGASVERRELCSPAEQAILKIISDAGVRLTTNQVLAILEKTGPASTGTTKTVLAGLVRRGLLDNRRDVDTPGYGITKKGREYIPR